MNKYRIIRKKSDQQIYLAEFQIEGWKYHGPYKDVKAAKAARNRREKDELMRDLGLKKVKGALGGTYWE
jgi:hypothetical protein